MDVSDLLPWIGAAGVVMTGLVGFFSLRAKGVFVDPDTLSTLTSTLSNEISKRRNLESKIDIASRRISSLEHNEQMNQRRMREMETEQDRLKKDLKVKDDYIQELLAGIEKLVAQIIRHDSSPEWRPHDKGK